MYLDRQNTLLWKLESVKIIEVLTCGNTQSCFLRGDTSVRTTKKERRKANPI